jgi:hypothetical protein
VIRLKGNWESLRIKGGACVSAFNEHFRVLCHQLDPHTPLSDEHLLNSYQFKLNSNPKVLKALIEKLGNQPAVSLNDIMEHVS